MSHHSHHSRPSRWPLSRSVRIVVGVVLSAAAFTAAPAAQAAWAADEDEIVDITVTTPLDKVEATAGCQDGIAFCMQTDAAATANAGLVITNDGAGARAEGEVAANSTASIP